ncbi:hypothetical protein T01_10295 [Trichinella spiralis]|uniref:Uncharacterized protein n=1 Tax=Trichinella spiralis TaxID=6334 RepID=A0A0V0YRT1_TRISP|nr:hypothetical protein T01_10295 [Trichinella spiralis]
MTFFDHKLPIKISPNYIENVRLLYQRKYILNFL